MSAVLDVNEAAKFLSLPVSAVRRLTRMRLLPVVRIPPGQRNVRYRVEDLERWVAENVHPEVGA